MAQFDDIRPYNDSEINAVMHRIADSPYFEHLASRAFPFQDVEDVKKLFRSINSVDEFQERVMYDLVQSIIVTTIDGFTFSGIENVKPKMRYLFISNHRDIVLDATLLQFILLSEKIPTTEISFGDNLMRGEFVIDLGRSNKMFKLMRGGNPREFLQNSALLSQYIRHTITEKHQSIWIAQRNGRTKNGIDLTEPGIIKMFNMSGKSDVLTNISELNIMPIVISYQYETCDSLKARELFLSRGKKYIKSENEDLNSILTGIVELKGKVHMHICKPITERNLKPLTELGKNEIFPAIAARIDKQIYSNYKLWDTNFIAHDILHKSDRFKDKYSDEARETFIRRMENKLSAIDVHDEMVRELFLEIYANPIERTEEFV